MCLEVEKDETLNTNLNQFDVIKHKPKVHTPKPKIPDEIEDIVYMKNNVPQRNHQVKPITKIVRGVYPDSISSEQTCFMNSKFIIDTKNKLSNSLKD